MMADNRYANYDEYGFRNLPRHLAASRNLEKLQILRQMLLDFDWLSAKLDATDINALLDDYDLIQGDKTINLVRDSLRLSAHVLSQDKSNLAFQLLGRMFGFEHPEIQNLMEQIKNRKNDSPWLRPITPCLPPPGDSLISTFLGHAGSVIAVALSADGRWAISGSDDKTLKLWDVETGQVLRTFRGHAGSVNAVALSADGRRAISGSYDKTLKLWDLSDGKCLDTTYLEGGVNCVAISSKGNTIVVGDEGGNMYFLKLEGV